MDQTKTGALIRALRLELGLTQKQLAESIFVSDKAVSKWERGHGCPDASLLPKLAGALGVEPGVLLSGEMEPNRQTGGNMKKLQFYVCPACSSIVTATGEAAVSCCGKIMQPQAPVKASAEEKLSVEVIDNEYFISSNHPMTKQNYITFVVLLTGDSIMLRKTYPEWDFQTRIPRFGHGKLVWHCTCHGLRYQII